MKRIALLAAVVALSVVVSVDILAQQPGQPASASAPASQAGPRKGYTTVQEKRPKSFPHRIWAASDFEVQLPTYGFFGKDETKNIPQYPGNVHARSTPPDTKGGSYTGMNPVPGPFMGKVNYMYCRYHASNIEWARFQHYSLAKNDNWNILVRGLEMDKWSELTLNFTRDARRNDGSPTPFTEVDRMDDLKVFLSPPVKEGNAQIILDDVIFFAMDPAGPEEKEPFPRRVMYTAGFDTGSSSQKDRDLFFPGKHDLVSGAAAPAGTYWSCLKGLASEDKKTVAVKLEMKSMAEPSPLSPTRTAGERTKVRFRYFLKGCCAITTTLHDNDTDVDWAVLLENAKENEWVWQYVDFTKAKPSKDGAQPLAAGAKLGSLEFRSPNTAEKVQLYIDEVTLYDAGE